MTLLSVDNLRVTFPTRTGRVEAVRGVSFTLGKERLGIVGESGSGKSQTGRAIMGLTPKQAEISADRLEFSGIDLLKASDKERRALRGRRVGMILQDPKYSLNPVMTIGRQIIETLQTHEKVSNREARERALAMLEAVQLVRVLLVEQARGVGDDARAVGADQAYGPGVHRLGPLGGVAHHQHGLAQ